MQVEHSDAPYEKRVFYSRLPDRRGPRKLSARLFFPGVANPPLLIWFHSGGFKSGSIDHPVHAEIASAFHSHGFACAFVEYRMQCREKDLSEQSQAILPKLLADAQQHDFGLKPFLVGAPALGAVESCVVFLNWLARTREGLGLNGPLMIGGSSAGAITVLNTLSLAPHLGLRLPRFKAVFAMTGAFAYPSFFSVSPSPIMALHNPNDLKVPIASMRAYAALPGQTCTLLENMRHPHGGLNLLRKESISVAVARMVEFATTGHVVEHPSNPL